MNDDYADPNESEGMKNMRKQLKEQGKQIKEYQDQLNQFQSQNRGSVISQALSSRGLDPRVAKFYPTDLGTDDESVGKWYQAMQDMEAYDARVVQDFKSQIDQIKYDPTNPDKAEAELLALLSANGVNLASM
jgi:hypothetical protein